MDTKGYYTKLQVSLRIAYFILLLIIRCILTPNKVEFERLIGAVLGSKDILSLAPSILSALRGDDLENQVRALSIALGGVTILRKGEFDVISSGDDVVVIREKGSPRRCGGLGDILAGSLGAAVTWADKVRYY